MRRPPGDGGSDLFLAVSTGKRFSSVFGSNRCAKLRIGREVRRNACAAGAHRRAGEAVGMTAMTSWPKRSYAGASLPRHSGRRSFAGPLMQGEVHGADTDGDGAFQLLAGAQGRPACPPAGRWTAEQLDDDAQIASRSAWHPGRSSHLRVPMKPATNRFFGWLRRHSCGDCRSAG